MSPRDAIARAFYLSQVHEAFLTDPAQNRRGLPAAPKRKGEHEHLYKSKAQRSGGVADA